MMGLRAFHLFFIALSVVLSAFFAAWCAGQYRVEQSPVLVVAAVFGLATAAGLATYGVAFQKKTRGW
jgi:enoyl-CoA hydratase/carnithine racemase